MMFTNALVAELRKTATMPAMFAGVAVALFGSAAITVLNALAIRAAVAAGQSESRAFTSAFETAFAASPLGTVGAVIIGVVAISSEYTANSSDAGGGRQITATLTASPQRLTVLSAKALTVVLLIAVTALVTIPPCLGIARVIIGDAVPETVSTGEVVSRSFGAALYWALSGLMALAITVLLRNGIIPLIVLIVNSSLVSVSFLLTKITPLAHYLPDLAGRRLFVGLSTVDGGLAAVPGAFVMGAWVFAMLGVAAAVFTRRDA